MSAKLLRRLLRNPALMAGAVLILAITLAAVFAPALATHAPNEQSLIHRLRPPGHEGHLLGTDHFGRDVFSRVLYGARISLQVGVLAVALSGVIGCLLGIVSGYFGGAVDLVIGRVIDTIMAFPNILLALAIVAALGPSLTNSIVAIGVASSPRFARVARAAAMSIREREFVSAAVALGARDEAIVLRHVLPNIVSPLIVITSLAIGNAILTEASLSFLGLGVAPPTATWGAMITDGKQFMDVAPWISVVSGCAIMLAVLGFNLFGDGLRDVLDVRSA